MKLSNIKPLNEGLAAAGWTVAAMASTFVALYFAHEGPGLKHKFNKKLRMMARKSDLSMDQVNDAKSKAVEYKETLYPGQKGHMTTLLKNLEKALGPKSTKEQVINAMDAIAAYIRENDQKKEVKRVKAFERRIKNRLRSLTRKKGVAKKLIGAYRTNFIKRQNGEPHKKLDQFEADINNLFDEEATYRKAQRKKKSA